MSLPSPTSTVGKASPDGELVSMTRSNYEGLSPPESKPEWRRKTKILQRGGRMSMSQRQLVTWMQTLSAVAHGGTTPATTRGTPSELMNGQLSASALRRRQRRNNGGMERRGAVGFYHGMDKIEEEAEEEVPDWSEDTKKMMRISKQKSNEKTLSQSCHNSSHSARRKGEGGNKSRPTKSATKNGDAFGCFEPIVFDVTPPSLVEYFRDTARRHDAAYLQQGCGDNLGDASMLVVVDGRSPEQETEPIEASGSTGGSPQRHRPLLPADKKRHRRSAKAEDYSKGALDTYLSLNTRDSSITTCPEQSKGAQSRSTTETAPRKEPAQGETSALLDDVSISSSFGSDSSCATTDAVITSNHSFVLIEVAHHFPPGSESREYGSLVRNGPQDEENNGDIARSDSLVDYGSAGDLDASSLESFESDVEDDDSLSAGELDASSLGSFETELSDYEEDDPSCLSAGVDRLSGIHSAGTVNSFEIDLGDGEEDPSLSSEDYRLFEYQRIGSADSFETDFGSSQDEDLSLSGADDELSENHSVGEMEDLIKKKLDNEVTTALAPLQSTSIDPRDNFVPIVAQQGNILIALAFMIQAYSIMTQKWRRRLDDNSDGSDSLYSLSTLSYESPLNNIGDGYCIITDWSWLEDLQPMIALPSMFPYYISSGVSDVGSRLSGSTEAPSLRDENGRNDANRNWDAVPVL